MPMTADAHECVFGPFEESRMAGTVHRKCQHPGCRMISLDGDDDDTEEECLHPNAVLSDSNPPCTHHCPDCGNNFISGDGDGDDE